MKKKKKKMILKNKFFKIIKYNIGILRIDKVSKCYNFLFSKLIGIDNINFKQFLYTYVYLKLFKKYKNIKKLNLYLNKIYKKKYKINIKKKYQLYWYTHLLKKMTKKTKYRFSRKNRYNNSKKINLAQTNIVKILNLAKKNIIIIKKIDITVIKKKIYLF